jgi:hypothetical protein
MMGDWTFFSNYGHVLVCLARDPRTRLRDVAAEVGITERAVQKIVRDMQDAGYLTVTKQGRCNRYRINRRKCLRHGLESHCTVGKLLTAVLRPGGAPVAEAPGAAVTEPPPAAADRQSPAAGETSPARATEPEKTRKVKKESAKEEPSPVDARQQGSLF